MILRCLESGEHPLEKFADRSMAVTTIEVLKRAGTNRPFAMVHGFRNHERPLWRMHHKGLIFASTKDIIVRSCTTSSWWSERFQDAPQRERDLMRTEPFVQYGWGSVSRRWHPMHLGTELPEDLQP